MIHDPNPSRGERPDPTTPMPAPDPSPSPEPTPSPNPAPEPVPGYDPGPPVRTVDLPPNQPSHGVPVDPPEPRPM